MMASTETLSYGTVTPVVPSGALGCHKWRDPCKDFASAASAITPTSGFVADTVVMGEDALSAFLSNATVQDQLNKLHLVVGGIQPTAPEGVGTAQFIGRLFRPYVSHLRLHARHTRTRRQRVEANDRAEGCPDRLLKVTSAHFLRQRDASRARRRDGEATAT